MADKPCFGWLLCKESYTYLTTRDNLLIRGRGLAPEPALSQPPSDQTSQAQHWGVRERCAVVYNSARGCGLDFLQMSNRAKHVKRSTSKGRISTRTFPPCASSGKEYSNACFITYTRERGEERKKQTKVLSSLKKEEKKNTPTLANYSHFARR